MDDNIGKYVEGAIRWALEKQGSEEYRFLCYGFLEDAYELGNAIILDGKGSSAKEAANAYGCQQGNPPRGSYVFFDCTGPIRGETKNWGHIGLALGDGRIIHSWQIVRINTLADIEDLDGGPEWTSPRYIGWAPPEQILMGMKIQS